MPAARTYLMALAIIWQVLMICLLDLEYYPVSKRPRCLAAFRVPGWRLVVLGTQPNSQLIRRGRDDATTTIYTTGNLAARTRACDWYRAFLVPDGRLKPSCSPSSYTSRKR